MIRVAIIGAGPAGFMMFKRLSNLGARELQITMFEKGSSLGSGMPYSELGAAREHVTNVSADELPDMSTPLDAWIKSLPDDVLDKFEIERDRFHQKKVVPRLLFGKYLADQFKHEIERALKIGLSVRIHQNTEIVDVIDNLIEKKVLVVTTASDTYTFDHVIICTGHDWRTTHEGVVDGYFDSPYPPKKLEKRFDHTVVLRGSSLTAIDAVKTVAKNNGEFFWKDGKYMFKPDKESSRFLIEMHSRDGLLPSLRVHMEEPHVGSNSLIEPNLIDQNRQTNDGFLELNFLFEEGFLKPLKESSPEFFNMVEHMTIEEFVEKMMSYRQNFPAFELLKKEYAQSLESVQEQESVPWKEMLGSLSFAMNYPAKHLSAEDMLRLRKHLLPLISVVIAFMPQSSCETLLALHEAGCLVLKSDGNGGNARVIDGQIIYEVEGSDEKQFCTTFINCIGQEHFNIDDFPFVSLVKDKTISGARLRFRNVDAAKLLIADGHKDIEEINGQYFLKVPGIAINDNFAVINEAKEPNNRLYIMAVPYIGGFNPDYSGLDFCEQASKRIVDDLAAFCKMSKNKTDDCRRSCMA